MTSAIRSLSWRGEGGKWFWKCHAGCGDGDEVTFLEKIKSISRAEAIKLLKEMAGVGAPPSKPRSSASAPDWRACVEAFDDKHLERLADWRGFSGEFCSWLKQNGLVGLYEKCIAFPVHDARGMSRRFIIVSETAHGVTIRKE